MVVVHHHHIDSSLMVVSQQQQHYDQSRQVIQDHRLPSSNEQYDHVPIVHYHYAIVSVLVPFVLHPVRCVIYPLLMHALHAVML